MRCSDPVSRRAACIAALAFVLAACQPVPQPFAHRPGSESHVIEPSTEIGGVAVLRVFGVPDAASRALSQAMAEALARHGIPAAPGSGNSRSKLMQGLATTQPAGAGKVEIDIIWDLFDRNGTLLGSRRHSRTLPAGAWRAGGPATMRTLTEGVAAEVAALVLGDAGKADTAAAIPLHVWPVAGAPAADDDMLRRAMEAALRRRDFAVTPELDGARLIVAGALRLGPAKEDPRPIEVTWSVLDADGQELGKLTQSNAVPAKALESDWQTLATVIAENAAGGVSALVRRLPPAALRGLPEAGKPGL